MLRVAASGLRGALFQAEGALRLTPAASSRFFAQEQLQRKPTPSGKATTFGSITIGQVMKEKAESGDPRSSLFWCKPEDLAFDAIKKMADANVGSIMVMKSPNPHRSEVEGIITERDYLRKVAVTGKSSKKMSCSALMTKQTDVLTMSPDDTVAQAMAVMEERNIRHLPVFDGDNLLGMMSIKDIVSTFIDQHEADVSSMSDYIAGGSY